MISEENIILALGDEKLESDEKEAIGRKLWRRRGSWTPGQMEIVPVKTPENFSEDARYWRVRMFFTF